MLLENKIIRLGPHKNNKTNDQKIVLAEENFCVYDQDQEDRINVFCRTWNISNSLKAGLSNISFSYF